MKRIFVSSTFKDMHEERDLLHTRILPELNEYARKTYGESLEFCDLRWGINTGNLDADEASIRILSVCLDEVEDCRPYMIVLLGDRYGYIPPQEQVQTVADTKEHLHLNDYELSITALEVEFGSLQDEEKLSHTLFYFRNIEGSCPSFYRAPNAQDQKKQKQFKEKIQRLPLANVKEYTLFWNEETETFEGMDAFEEMVKEDIRNLLKKEWQPYADMDAVERNLHLQREFALQKAASSGGRDWVYERFLWHLKHGSTRLLLKGAPNTGKTTCMCGLADCIEKEGSRTLSLFGGISAGTDTITEILCHIARFLEIETGLPKKTYLEYTYEDPEQINDMFEYVRFLIQTYEEQSEIPLVILLDGLYNLRSSIISSHIENFLSCATQKTAVICSVPSNCNFSDTKCVEIYTLGKRKEDFIPEPLRMFHDMLKEDHERLNLWEEDDGVISESGRNSMKYALDDMFDSGIEKADIKKEKLDLIQSILSFQKKELDPIVIQAMIEKEAADTPFYLDLLIRRLLLMNKKDFEQIKNLGDQMEHITSYQLSLISEAPDSLEELCIWFLETASTYLGNPDIKDALYFIALSETGLRETDLEKLMFEKQGNWSALEFSLFARYMGSIFTKYEDGRYIFSNATMKKSFWIHCQERERIHKLLFHYIKTLPQEDILYKQEMISRCYYADEKKEVITYLTSHQRSTAKKAQIKEELWNWLAAPSYAADHTEQSEMIRKILWLMDCFENVNDPDTAALLLELLMPYFEQLFLDKFHWDIVTKAGDHFANLAKCSNDNYNLSWILSLQSKHLLRNCADLYDYSESDKISVLFDQAKENSRKALELLQNMLRGNLESTTLLKERLSCLLICGDVAANRREYQEALNYYDKAVKLADISKEDMPLMEDASFLTKYYICLKNMDANTENIQKAADRWKQFHFEEVGTEETLLYLKEVILPHLSFWPNDHFMTPQFRDAVYDLFGSTVSSGSAYISPLFFEEESLGNLVLYDGKGKAHRLELFDLIRFQGREYLITSGEMMGQPLDSQWIWEIRDSAHPDYSLELVQSKDRELRKTLMTLMDQRLSSGSCNISDDILRFRSYKTKLLQDRPSGFTLHKRWYYKPEQEQK